MNVIIAGAGEVGGHAAEVLSATGHNVTVIDLNVERLEALNDALDLRTYPGNCAHLGVLQDAGVDRCDLFVAATQIDEINLLAAFLAKSLGAKKTIVRVHHTANFALRNTVHVQRLGVDELICPEYLTALMLARTLRNPGLIALEEFGQGLLLMQKLPVTDGSPAVGKTLAEIRLPSSVRVATVETSGGPQIARADTLISEGDQVTLLGETKAFDQARKLFHKGKDGRLSVTIMGETSTAVWLCRALRARTFSVRLFVSHEDRAEELSAKLEHVTVLKADPTDASVFLDEHLEKTDAFVAVTEDDEQNILACAQAKALGIKKAIAVVQRTKYLHLFPHVGIDHAYSPRSVAVGAIQFLIDVGSVRSLATLAEGIAAVYEIHPAKKCPLFGFELRNVSLPAQTMIAAIQRDDRVIVPGADDQIQPDDILLAIGPVGLEDELGELFGV